MVDNTPADFHRLDGRLRLQGTLTLQTALHVGAGKSAGEGTDMPVLRDAEGYPFIPGASIKGVLRSTLEALVRAVDKRDRGVWACNPLVDKFGEEGAACGLHDKSKGEQRSDVDPNEHCAICRLFGSRIVASHIRISDALIKERERRPPIELRDGVAIDRDLRTASPGKKYDFEVVAPGTQFNLEVFVENPRDWLMGLLTIGFDQIADGFTALGGFSSRGLGRATLEWTDVKYFTAKQLLEGKEPEQFSREKLSEKQSQWRDALAEKVSSHV